MKNNKIIFAVVGTAIAIAIILIIFLLIVPTQCSKQQSLATEAETTITQDIQQETVTETETTAAKETTAETTAETATATATETTAATAVAPTIKLEIYEGPTYSPADNVCYYRIKATVTGSPVPTIAFSKDDSGGVWGTDRVQINIHEGESYNLIAVAKSSAGVASDSILLTWGCSETPETTAVEETAAFAVTSVIASVDPAFYEGMCPADITWSAVITVNGPGTVSYQWEVEGGSTYPSESITFSSAGSKTVTSHHSMSAGYPDNTLWLQIRILSPNEMVSNQATSTLTCYPDIDVRPTIVNFGAVACGSSATYGVIIKNVSWGKLDIISANITSGGSFFSIDDDSCTGSSLFIEQQCIIGIKFGPLSVCGPIGTIYGGNLRIKSNDPDEGTVNVSLTAKQS